MLSRESKTKIEFLDVLVVILIIFIVITILLTLGVIDF